MKKSGIFEKINPVFRYFYGSFTAFVPLPIINTHKRKNVFFCFVIVFSYISLRILYKSG